MGKDRHTIFTIVVPVLPGEHEGLRAKLVKLDYVGYVPGSDVLGFDDMDMLHYASMFLYEDPQDGWQFVFEHNIDGEINAYLNRLIDVASQKQSAGAKLLELYSHCSGFTDGDLPTLRAYMAANIHHPSAAFVAGVGLTRNRIRKDAAIHRVVDRVLNGGHPKMSAEEAEKAVFAALVSDLDIKNFTDPAGDSGHKPGLVDRLVDGASLVLPAIGFLALGAFNLRKEGNANEDNRRPHAPLVRAQKKYEDHTPTNHMASIVYLHTDWSRQWAKRAAYRLLSSLIELISYNGVLGSIDTIHFAHWAILNGGRRILFVSSYDGSWDSYLDDFTLKSSAGLTLAWAHGIGIPRSKWMLKGGTAKGPEFIDWARQSMVPCPVWYNAYPGVSARHVIRNRNLRTALAAAKAGKSGADWLKHA